MLWKRKIKMQEYVPNWIIAIAGGLVFIIVIWKANQKTKKCRFCSYFKPYKSHLTTLDGSCSKKEKLVSKWREKKCLWYK